MQDWPAHGPKRDALLRKSIMSDTIVTKSCSKCKQVKSFVQFGPDARNQYGLQSQCRVCRAVYSARYAKTPTGRATRRVASEKYNLTEKGVQTKRRSLLRAAESDRCRKWRLKYPLRVKAEMAVSLAVRKGDLCRAGTLVCVNCGDPAYCYHHTSYAREHWLRVVAMCRSCHSRLHHTLL